MRFKEVDSPWDFAQFHAELFNPFHMPGWVSGTKEGRLESAENTAYLMAVFTGTGLLLNALSGGGASMTYHWGMGKGLTMAEGYSVKYGVKKAMAEASLRLLASPTTWILASTAAHMYTSSEIERMQPGVGAQSSLALQYANTGSFSGGSMPVVMLPRVGNRNPETQQGKSFLEDLWMTATGGVW